MQNSNTDKASLGEIVLRRGKEGEEERRRNRETRVWDRMGGYEGRIKRGWDRVGGSRRENDMCREGMTGMVSETGQQSAGWH